MFQVYFLVENKKFNAAGFSKQPPTLKMQMQLSVCCDSSKLHLRLRFPVGAFKKNFACSFTAKIVCIHVMGAQTPLSLTKYRSNYNLKRSPVVVSGSSLLPLPRPGPRHPWK